MEKLLVEFDVERTIPREYGYEEKLLKFRGNNTKYKAIVKDGKLVAIVSRNYKLIPNEKVKEILKELAIKYNLNLLSLDYGYRTYNILSKKDIGVMISNSVDGTIALRVDACLKLQGWAIIVGKQVRNLYKKHSRNLSVADLDKEIFTILEVSKEYRGWIDKLSEFKLKDYIKSLQALAKVIPKVYTKGLDAYALLFPDMTLKRVYEIISTRIWSRDTDIRTKISLYKKLNDVIMGIGVMTLL